MSHERKLAGSDGYRILEDGLTGEKALAVALTYIKKGDVRVWGNGNGTYQIAYRPVADGS